MTLSEAVFYADDKKPNAFSQLQKARWISECEGMIQSRVLLMAPVEFLVYEYPKDENVQLLIGAPFDKLYISYLCAMIDFANGEYENYQNTLAMFNSDLSEFSGWFAMRYRPADTNRESMTA